MGQLVVVDRHRTPPSRVLPVCCASGAYAPAGEVDADHVAAEGEAGWVEEWASAFTDRLRRVVGTPLGVGPDTEVVLERFEVRFPPRPRATAGNPQPVPAPVK